MKKITIFVVLMLFSIIGAQAQSTLGTISGTVRDERGELLTGAAITVKNGQTGFTASTISGISGNFKFTQIPLGTDYSITSTFLGYGTKKITGYAINQGDHLRVDISLSQEATTLEEVSVSANSLKNNIDRFGSSTAVDADAMSSLPVNGRNFTSLTDLSPVSNGGNLLGQLYSSTNYTIDGMTNKSPVSSGATNRGPFSISMEAIREFEVVTNDYDVTNGRSGGGNISAVTKSGTNQLEGSAFFYNRADWLSSPYDTRGNKREDEFAIQQYGLTLGGPIIKDKLHYFVAYDGQRDARPLYIADIRTTEDEARYNLSQESLDRYLSIARGEYGVADSPQTGSFDKLRYSHTAFVRLDYQINDSNLLTVRNNYSRDFNEQGVGDNSPIELFETYGNHLSEANSLMASLRTKISNKLTNELKLQYLYTLDEGSPNDQLPKSNIPRAIVERVESVVNDRDVNTTIQLGGQRYLPERFKSNVYQLVNNLYYNSGNVNYTFGMDMMVNNLTSLATSEFNGRFYFTGLDNFDNLTPYRYAREVAITDPTVSQNIFATGIYGQGETYLGNGMNLILGLRADYTKYLNKPTFNQTVFDELGLRTDHSAGGFQVQPRFQFTWDINEQERDIIRVGGGIFGSALNNYSDINNLQFDGTKIFAIDVTGENVPVPDFESYREDPSTAPGVDLLNQPGINTMTTINMNSEDLKIPTVYKANIMYNRIFNDRFRMGANFIMSLARNNYMYIDRNMVDDPYFRLANEADRGVYVPTESINPSNGAADWTQGRKTDELGRVLELVSEGKNNTFTVVIDGTYQYYKDGQISFSYTWNDTKDNTSYNGNVANSATLFQMVVDDPRDLSMMNYSNSQFRNKVVFYGTLPSFKGFKLGVRYSGIGGTRYSLRVNGNVNGDFVSSNDLAYVFDPNNAALPENIIADMNDVLANPDNLAKDYIQQNLGKVATRNGGINGYYGTWDLRLSKKFYLNPNKRQGIELGGDIFNVANLLSKNWGTSKNLSNQNLTTITGFDPASSQYTYNINSNVGVAYPGGTPYQLQISAKVFF